MERIKLVVGSETIYFSEPDLRGLQERIVGNQPIAISDTLTIDALISFVVKNFIRAEKPSFSDRCKLIGEGAKAILDASMPKFATSGFDHQPQLIAAAMNLAMSEFHSNDQPKSAAEV